MFKGQYGQHRLLEVIPGALTWTVIVCTFVSAFFLPTAAIVFIIIFDLYWLLRVLYFVIHVLSAYFTYRKTINVAWHERIENLDRHRDIWHVVMLPTFKEELPILRGAFDALLVSNYQKDRMIVVLGGEGRDEENFKGYRAVLEKEYGDSFAKLICTVHHLDAKTETPGKGSNLRSMARELKKYIDAEKIPYDDIIVSAFDVDTVAHSEYFAKLTYDYLTIPNPTRTSFQPVTLFSNNIWSANAPVRIAAFGTTFWLLGELVRPERMWTFSSHSMPWRMLVDVGFWEPDLVSEDSRIFMQGFLRYDGAYRVTPVFLPVSMDTVAEGSYWQSLKALYKQQRRWAWGVEHFPYMVAQFKKHPNIKIFTKVRYIFNHLEGMLTWATAPILIFVLGRLPFVTSHDASSVLVVNSPYTLEWMMRAATFGVFVTGALSFFLLPRRPQSTPVWSWVMMVLQWLLLPVTFVLFGALPAIDAQTRLMLGKYLGFNVTKKSAASRK